MPPRLKGGVANARSDRIEGSGGATVRARLSERLGEGAGAGRVVGILVGTQGGLRGGTIVGGGNKVAGRTMSIHTAWDLSNLLRTTYGAGFFDAKQFTGSYRHCLLPMYCSYMNILL